MSWKENYEILHMKILIYLKNEQIANEDIKMNKIKVISEKL